jgi:heme/copper-type cytochrome/quinol oxidase subunit 2
MNSMGDITNDGVKRDKPVPPPPVDSGKFPIWVIILIVVVVVGAVLALLIFFLVRYRNRKLARNLQQYN